jgi:hypothetical protein
MSVKESGRHLVVNRNVFFFFCFERPARLDSSLMRLYRGPNQCYGGPLAFGQVRNLRGSSHERFKIWVLIRTCFII